MTVFLNVFSRCSRQAALKSNDMFMGCFSECLATMMVVSFGAVTSFPVATLGNWIKKRTFPRVIRLTSLKRITFAATAIGVVKKLIHSILLQ